MFLEKQESGKLNRGGECYYSGLSRAACVSAAQLLRWLLLLSGIVQSRSVHCKGELCQQMQPVSLPQNLPQHH